MHFICWILKRYFEHSFHGRKTSENGIWILVLVYCGWCKKVDWRLAFWHRIALSANINKCIAIVKKKKKKNYNTTDSPRKPKWIMNWNCRFQNAIVSSEILRRLDFRVSFSLELHIFAVVFITFTFEYGSVHITFFFHRPNNQPIKFTIAWISS